MPIIWGEVSALTSDPAYPAILFLEPFGPRRLTSPWHGEPVPAPASDPAYLAILFPQPFGPRRGC